MAVVERLEHREVEGVRVGRFTSKINTTCIVYRWGETVIDVGPPNQWRWVREFVEERQARRVLVTHHHEDHSGNLAAVGRATGAELLGAPEALEPLASGFRLQAYRRLIWGRPGRVEAAPLPESVPAGEGSLTPVSTPGHSPDMTCYLEPERGWLFTGDLYIASKPRYLRADENISEQIRSLKKILALDFELLFCSHRGVVEEGRAALQAKVDYLVDLRERARRLHDQGLGSREITRRLLGREDFMSWITALHFCKRNLIRSCLEDARGGDGRVC
jgi:glyoxylase-like metal-dependent hydrolase (beta-lactamase superfamily II)